MNVNFTASTFKWRKQHTVWASGILTAASFILKETIGMQPVTVVMMLLATAIAGLPIARKAIGAIRYWIVGIDALVTVAVMGAVIIGEYWEAAAVTFLFILGDYLESRTIEKTRSSIRALMDLVPDTARVRRNGIEEVIPSDDVVKDDIVIVRPGEKIAVDGEIIEGTAYINQAAITGESMPVTREPGESVFSGTVIESGFLLIRAVRVGEDTTFARILHMVEEAQDKKARAQQFLERFSRWYTPGIIVLAAVVYLITRDIRLALTLLVISCPGALVISTPISIVAGIGNAAKHGVLIKGGDIMEKLGTVKAIAFDKTGTLPLGKPGVTDVHAFTGTPEDVLRIATVGEAYSEHPLARAIIAHSAEKGMPTGDVPKSADIRTGQGVVFAWQGQSYAVGNRALMESEGIPVAEHEVTLAEQEDKGRTVVLLGGSGTLMGYIAIADQIRPESAGLIRDLRSLGIKRVVMLTGDNQRAAREVARQVGLDHAYAELMPEDKVRVLQELADEMGSVAMVGDGVNDAPALASADLGVAVG
ncbi:MAG: cadmium-translocating P-type ATPase, partial [Clostridiales bacterium]|nr:cadmium-translocating P-type ATPase [Clostridiales bacterium]